MGMDLSVYRLLEALPPEEDEGATEFTQRTRTLSLSAAQVESFRALFPKLQTKVQEFLKTEQLKAVAQVDVSWYLSGWDLTLETGWAEFSDPDGLLPSRLIEVRSKDYLEISDEVTARFAVKELGYLRKPFRFESTPTRIEGDTVVLSIDNFTGSDTPALTEVLGPKVMDDCYALWTSADLTTLTALKKLCSEPGQWQHQILDQMTGTDCIAVLDW